MSSSQPGLALVPFAQEHLAQTLQWTNDPALARVLDRARRVTEEEHERWFAALSTRQDTVYFAIQDDGRHIGNVWLADINPRHRKAEVRIVLAPNAADRGCGSRALELIAEHAFTNLNLHRLYAF